MSNKQDDAADIEQAKRNATVAKARVQTTVGALKQRLNPKTMAADAVENVKGRTSAIGDVAKRRPGAASAAAGVAALIVLRKPLGKLARRLFSRKAKDERRKRKEEKQLAVEWRRAEKAKRRDDKLRQRELRKEAKIRASEEPDENGLIRAGAPEDLTSLPAHRAAAVSAKQE